MRRDRGRAFTLVEMLVVIAILVILVALIMPAVTAAWDTVMVVQCTHNLETIYKGLAVWRAEVDSTGFIQGVDWNVRLIGYVEDHETVFRCPAAHSRTGSGHVRTEVGVMEFDMYRQGEYVWSIPIDGQWVRRTEVEPGRWLYEVEDKGWKVEQLGESIWIGYDDLAFEITYEGDQPVTLRILPKFDYGSGGSTSANTFDFKINGEVFVKDWVSHYGSGDKAFPLGRRWQLCDYGLSRGTFEDLAGPVSRHDPKAFLILDYAKPVADYNQVSEEDPWSKYFILDSEAWMRRHSGELGQGETWEHYQSLRHLGRANVLYCDGRIELLGPEDLYETNPRWRVGGL